MPAIPSFSHGNPTLTKRLVTSDNGDIDVPRLLGVIFIIILFLAILYLGGRSVSARRRRQMYNTARNRGPVRVQRLERASGRTSRRSGGSGGSELPPWSQGVNRRDPVEDADGGVTAPPPVYVKDQEGATVQRDPPPPYAGRDGPS